MKTVNNILFICLTLICGNIGAQNLKQTVRGTIVDADAKTTLIGATVIIENADTLLGDVSNIDGEFKITNVPVGRIRIKIKSLGYQDVSLGNILVESGKEKVLTVEMTEDITKLAAVVVTAKEDKSGSINNMATVSSKMFTVEETNRYAGSLNDPARMVSAYAGVSGSAEGNNDIVVRGNSPRGVLWRLEGIDIPNPNHFASEGSTGGPVNSLNGSMLANSDFFSGAFAPEYGNALSGVFDVKFRKGNNEKREYNFSASLWGIDGTLEGPIKSGYNGSYLVNYRYSTIALLDQLGVLDFNGIPIYQDASFNLVLPTKKAGTFSLVGLGGLSHIDQTYRDEETDSIFNTDNFAANLGVVGLKHVKIINPKLYIKSYISVTTAGSGWEDSPLDSLGQNLFLASKGSFVDNKAILQSIINYKANKKNSFQLGATGKLLGYTFSIDSDDNEDGEMFRDVAANGSSSMMQSFVSWKHRINNKVTFISGLHHMHFFLNDNYTVEPRLGLKWQATPRHSFSLAYGHHSRMESISTYLFNEQKTDGSSSTYNENLDFSKSRHYVAGYGFQINENLHFKSEVYYQQLYSIPVSKEVGSSFSMINTTQGIPNMELSNDGTGENYGVELTLDRFFHNNFYYMATGSLYKSSYSTGGKTYSTRYDANYAANLLLGKEFYIGKSKNKTWGINTKVSLLGGERYTEIDLEASRLAGKTVLVENAPFGKKSDDVFFFNLGITYHVNKKRTSHSIKLDIQNLTNYQAKLSSYYDSNSEKIGYNTQLPILPNIIYTIKF